MKYEVPETALAKGWKVIQRDGHLWLHADGRYCHLGTKKTKVAIVVNRVLSWLQRLPNA